MADLNSLDLQKDILEVMEKKDSKNAGLKIDDIVKFLRASMRYAELDEEILKVRVNQVLYQGTKRKTDKKFKKVENPKKKGSFFLGMYKRIVEKDKPNIIRNPKPNPKPTQENKENDKTLHRGKGGEFAVMSELLFRGYYANLATVDDGVDIIAWKDKAVFFVQVKTTLIEDSKCTYQIKKDSFERYNRNNMFYVFVMRATENEALNKSVNWFLVFPSSTIQHYIDTKYINAINDSYSIKFENKGDKIFIKNGTKEDDIAPSNLNKFSLIKE